MKFTCSQSALLKAVNTVSRAVSLKTTVPALKGILMNVKDHQLFLTASDLDFSVITSVDVVEAEEGGTIVSAKLFSDIVRKLPNAMIRGICDNKNRFTISCLDSEFNIVGAAAEEYPSISSPEETETFSFSSDKLIRMVSGTAFAASTDEKKGVLTGCLFTAADGAAEMVSLDGFRMAMAKTSIGSESRFSVVIPARILQEISKVISEQECESVAVSIGNIKIGFSAGNVLMTSRLLEGEFIRYKEILPKMYRTRVVVPRQELLSSVERASLFVSEGKNNLIRLSVQENGIRITSGNETGNVSEFVNAELEGEPIEIGFNSKYLLDVLKTVSDEELALEMTNSLGACIVKQVEADEFSFLVLPVRLGI